MKLTEQVLIAVILIAGIAFKVLGLFEHEWTVGLMATTYLCLFALIVFYMFRTGWSVYTLVMATMQGGMLGIVFTIQHWPGQGPMRLLGHLGLLGFSYLIVRHGLKSGTRNFYLFATAGLIVGQVICAFALNTGLWKYGNLLYFPLVATIGTLKLNKFKSEFGMDKVLNLILIQGILFVTSHSLNLLK